MSEAFARGRASCQNQDLRDYRIFRIYPARVRIRLGGISVVAKWIYGSMNLVRIRIYGVIGFSGFVRRAFVFVLAGFPLWRKAQDRRAKS